MNIYSEAHLTFSNKIRFEKYLDEISRRDAIPAEKILSLPEIKAILENQDMNKSQKGEKLVNHLYALRYPEITRCEEKYKKSLLSSPLRGEGQGEGEIRKHSPFFEGSDISFQIKTGGDYELRIHQPEK